jgi:cytochrome P450
MAKVVATYPRDIHPHAIMPYLQAKYNLPPIYYVDTWPFGYSICAIVDPDVAMQATVQTSLPKHEALVDAIGPLTGYHSLVSIEGKEHRRWRNIFNPGFSNAHLMTLVDGIVADGLLFMDILGKHAATGDIFLLEEAATRLTVDIIVRVVL